MVLNLSKARNALPDLVNRAAYGKERTILARHGKELAAVVPIEDLRLLERLMEEEEDRRDLAIAKRRLAANKGKKTISHAELKRKYGL